MTGSGTLLDPFVIWDVNDLQDINLDLTAYYELGQDIDASATVGWNGGLGFAPIPASFTGSLDGRGFTIDGLVINRPAVQFVALFLNIGVGGRVSNLGLTNVNITGDRSIATLAETNYGTVTNCYTTGNVRAVLPNAWDVAGFIDDNYGIITNSWSSANVTGETSVAGFVQWNVGTIRQCFSTGNVSTVDSGAGFVDWNTSFGVSRGTIIDCYTRSRITITGPAGFISAGGFVNDNGENITNCYAANTIIGAITDAGFGFVNTGTITNCFWDREVSSQINGLAFGTNGITSLTTAEMKNSSIFIAAGWGFGTVWGRTNSCNNGYPCLLGVTPSCAWALTLASVQTLAATGVT